MAGKGVMLGLGKGLGKWTGSIVMMLVSKWKFSITAIILAFILFSSTVDSIQQKNAFPIIKELGSRVLSFDYSLSMETDKLIENGGVYVKTPEAPTTFFGKIWKYPRIAWGYIKSISGILATGWLVFILGKLIYWTISHMNKSTTGWWVLMTIILIYMTSSVYSVVANYADGNYQGWEDAHKGFSMDGTVKFITKGLPLMIHPAYEGASKLKPIDESYITQNAEPPPPNVLLTGEY